MWLQIGTCFGVTGRHNANEVDLNRNFPDQFHPNSTVGARQPETLAAMQWIKSTNFTLSASMHGGNLVASYPFDSHPQLFDSRQSEKVSYLCCFTFALVLLSF